ncbi:MAG: hypothetical protein FD175_2371 [Beijerinckiaceae bacterium]|nr:MAG: hypothetical protein FD175_2371 [Beijerinckiaceae bacterium]
MLTHEPQNREMALIRCPNCDTLHDLEGSFFASGARKVRCASCRTVWEAADPESGAVSNLVIPKLDANREAANSLPEFEATEETSPLDQAAIDAIDFSTPDTNTAIQPSASAPAQEGDDISAAELEALFADEAKASSESTASEASDRTGKPAEHIEFDPASLARAQDEAGDATSEASIEERRKWRREKHLAATEAHHRAPTKGKKSGSTAVIMMAAGVGTLAMLGILRNEAVRLFPASAPLFEAVGLNVTPGNLDISDIRSRLMKEEGRETLEVTGTVTNLTQSPQKIPIMRLSIRGSNGQEIYVWTASVDQPELGPREKTTFRRRLASPPAESHSVMVRFVAKDDIVAAIR